MGAVDSNVKIIQFCVPLPSSFSFLPTDYAHSSSSTSSCRTVDSGFGIVGTITLRGRSAVVWFGWGAIEAVAGSGEEECDIVEGDSSDILSVGNGAVYF